MQPSEIEGFARALAARARRARCRHGGVCRTSRASGSLPSPRTWSSTAAGAICPGRRPPAGRRPSAGPCHQSTTWATSARRSFHHRARSRPEPVDQLESLRELVEDMDARPGRDARHPRRQSGLHRAGGLPLRGAHAEGAAARPPGPVPGRDLAPVPLAPARGALPGSLERHPRLRRHRLDRAAADRAAVPGPLGSRTAVGRCTNELRDARLRDRARLLARALDRHAARRGDFEDVLADGAARRRHGRHRRLPAQVGHAATRAGRSTCKPPADRPAGEGYEIVFQPDPTIYDGRFANNGWLQELPKPITKLTWDNAALMSPATAQELGVGLGSYAHGGEHGGYHAAGRRAASSATARCEAPVWIMPGHADGSITVHLGYGRRVRRAGRRRSATTRSASTPMRCARRTISGSRPAWSVRQDQATRTCWPAPSSIS